MERQTERLLGHTRELLGQRPARYAPGFGHVPEQTGIYLISCFDARIGQEVHLYVGRSGRRTIRVRLQEHARAYNATSTTQQVQQWLVDVERCSREDVTEFMREHGRFRWLAVPDDNAPDHHLTYPWQTRANLERFVQAVLQTPVNLKRDHEH